MKPPPNRTVIAGVKSKVSQIEKAIYPTLKDVFTKYDNVIKETNTQEQLFNLGQDAKSDSLGSYAESTKRIKIRKRQPIDRVTLKDTGAFYDSITVIATPNEVIIETSIEYAQWLVKRYGKDILGIQDVFLNDFYLKYIVPELDNEINKIIEK
jgi:hypothetical protein